MSRLSRRAFCGGLAGFVLFTSGRVTADELPAPLQAELVTRLASYDRNMKSRAGGDTVNVTILVKPGDRDSQQSAAQLASAVGRVDRVGALTFTVNTLPYVDSKGLADACKASHTSVVFLTEQLGGEVESVRRAFDGQDVLTIAPSADMTRRGVVLGFELVSSRPKLFINLPAAEHQNVSMPAEILKLMTVYR